MAFDSSYVVPVIIGKIVSGLCAVVVGAIVYNKMYKKG